MDLHKRAGEWIAAKNGNNAKKKEKKTGKKKKVRKLAEILLKEKRLKEKRK